MELRHLLLAYVLLTNTFTSSMWLIGGTWMGMSRKAASHWLRASLVNGLALILLLVDIGLPRDASVMLAASLIVVSTVSLQRGLRAFFRQPQEAGKQIRLTLGAVAFNLLLCLPLGLITLGIVMSCALACFLLLRVARDTRAALSREFRPGTAAASDTMLGITALYFASIATVALLGRLQPRWLPSDDVLLGVLVCASSGLSISVSFLLGYIVVMRLVYRLQHLSQHDSLTGLLNRRAIEQSLDREVQRLQRFGESFCVMLVDIDHFKRINDHLGHAAGDEVLRSVAQVLRAQAREVDRVARYGGEEFCVLLPHTDAEGALQAGERLRTAVNQTDILWQDELIGVTVSTGVACAIDPSEPLHELLRRADDALYQAKADGRNRVVAASPRRAA
ncbi:MAG: GGDEF domain-containing protein [Burkholderiales bacterium]|nr:GGDEF domain-containing protein [Burkholderiales bacterium]MBH2016979.1 GGDEF domain-containing protein [Burkholderiales bacterium]